LHFAGAALESTRGEAVTIGGKLYFTNDKVACSLEGAEEGDRSSMTGNRKCG
jgi:hypothetical protein